MMTKISDTELSLLFNTHSHLSFSARTLSGFSKTQPLTFSPCSNGISNISLIKIHQNISERELQLFRMKAMASKGLLSKYSQRHSKKDIALSPEEKLLNMEEKQISSELGIDVSEIEKYRWLFEQIRFTRILVGDEESGKVKYLDLETKVEHNSSPLLGLFKKTLYEKVDHSKAAFGFDDKARKLLPFMEDKLARERIGLASKRKEAERVNLVRDEKGKVTTSKTERIVPDTKKMLISRDYLLKMIVDKVITKGELFGRGKRARQFSLLLEKAKKQREVKEEFAQLGDLSIDQIQGIYSSATEFYLKTIGALESIPPIVQDSRAYKSLTPDTVAKSLTTLGVQKERIQQYWFGKIMTCLPLPPDWTQRKGVSQQPVYLYQPLNLPINVHPSINYIIHQINQFRNRFAEMGDEEKQRYYQNRQMSFIDFFDRTYKVDMFLILSKQEERFEEPHEVFAEKSINDWLIVEGAAITNLQPEHYHLAESIEDYFRESLDGSELWYPQVSPFGEIIWTNTITTLCTSICPIQKEMNDSIQPLISLIPEIQIKDYNQLFAFMQSNPFMKGIYQRAMNQKKRFLGQFINNTQFQWGKEFVENQELVFHCPFDFQSLFEETVPTWMEKVTAKSYQKIVKLAHQSSSTPQQISNTQDLISQYLNILKQNPHWDTYFKQTLSGIDSNKHSIEVAIKSVFDYDQRTRWLKFQNKKSYQKIAQQSKMKYIQAHKHTFKQPAVVEEEPQSESEVEIPEEEAKSKSNEPTVSTKKYFNIQSEYDYDRANRIINAIQEWSQTDSNTDLEKQRAKRYENDFDMVLITDQKQLDEELREMKKKVNKTKKFTSARDQTKLLDKINETANDYQRIVYKNGLLKSKLKDQTAAMNKKSREKFLRKEGVHNSRAQTSRISHSDPSINMFNSICSHYTNSSIDKLVLEKQREEMLNQEKRLLEEPEESHSPRPEYKRESVFVLPKEFPSILPLLKKKDQNFVHISQADGDYFKGVFNRDKSQTPTEQRVQRKSLHQHHKSSQNLKSISKVNRHARSQSKIQKTTNPPPSLNPQVITKVRCLESTCSHLLNSNAVASKLVFDRLEIRKQLYLKNRGIKLIHI